MKLANLTSALKALDVTKATGLDGITPRILKITAETVAPTLLDIINVSLINSQYPETLKLAKIKPIHKGGTRSDPSNYRPISVLQVASKIIEKTYYKTLICLSKQVRYFTQISVWVQEKPFMQYSIIKFVRQMVEKY